METRFNQPSRFSSAEFKKLVKVIGETVNDTVEYDIFIQTSRDEDNVRWVEAGEFLLVALENKLSDPAYLDILINAYETKKRIIKKDSNNEKDSLDCLTDDS